ncbi:MAG: hypothetical protein KF746_02840 [Chitinophagaceae bacterium]|nr:hypothetical protein [Chitinophagaceae bacterium]
MEYIIEPEVSGQLGNKTVIDSTIHPPKVSLLHFVFYGWLGDDIIECFPVFLITQHLKTTLNMTTFSGFEIKDCTIDVSEEFRLLQPKTDLPSFFWLDIVGSAHDDFKIVDNRLQLSSRAFEILKRLNLNNAIIKEIL